MRSVPHAWADEDVVSLLVGLNWSAVQEMGRKQGKKTKTGFHSTSPLQRTAVSWLPRLDRGERGEGRREAGTGTSKFLDEGSEVTVEVKGILAVNEA